MILMIGEPVQIWRNDQIDPPAIEESRPRAIVIEPDPDIPAQEEVRRHPESILTQFGSHLIKNFIRLSQYRTPLSFKRRD